MVHDNMSFIIEVASRELAGKHMSIDTSDVGIYRACIRVDIG